MNLEPEVAVECRCELGEGPVWDDGEGILLWVDILAGHVYRFEVLTGALGRIDLGESVGAVALVEGGGLVAALHREFALVDPNGHVSSRSPRIVPEGRRMNDGKCDPLGRFWAGTLADDGAPGGGALYCLEPDGTVTTVIDSVTISNGIDWSPDGRRMYYADSATGRVDVFEFDTDTGGAFNPKPFAAVAAPGLPDGLTVDSAGCVWLAVFNGWEVLRFSPDGDLDLRLRVPVAKPTSVTFGGADLTTLYITSGWHRLQAEDRAGQPHAGDVFSWVSPVSGLPARRYVNGSRSAAPTSDHG